MADSVEPSDSTEESLPEEVAAQPEVSQNEMESAHTENSRPAGLEPISFDDLDELEQLLSDDDSDVSSGDLDATFDPDDDSSGLLDEMDGGLDELLGNNDAPDPSSEEIHSDDGNDSADKPANDSSPTIWRVKSDRGLTYSFFSIDSLKRWFSALGEQQNALVTVDNVEWKAFGDFEKQLADNEDARSAFKNTQAREQDSAEPAAPIEFSPKTQSGTHTSPRKSRGHTVERSRPTGTGRGKTGEAHQSRSGRRTGSGSRAGVRRKGQEPAPAPTWSGQIAFMALGLVVGGAGVYFGMYLLGFYELTF